MRITVVDRIGSFIPVHAFRTGAPEAVRTGIVYTGDGRTSIGVPAGDYQVYASRGFEYSAPSARVRVVQGQHSSVLLKIRREVMMSGFASCDTHVHTLELSGHGDANVEERVLTAAEEGLDLMVAEANLSFQISTLREGARRGWREVDRNGPEYGYRFTANVQHFDGDTDVPMTRFQQTRD